ncbi:extracellular catalytic domain type 1 short-chain-length polyhydroxyalkanoate depolymerase [Pseudotabrizicola formosa]|uniref:extracellular catalytic domain type 1 short-chain-length polyhydroxyalkanoate depolymerase n=1 Tax=Pseudotabrizicola formosa TaxID=2030009 RepID=UPI000CD16E1A|nr:PHB depolymerase family esterase [Pseudotabrizicola formosa]
MTKSFMQGMSRASDLTRSGKLTEATALIQSLLSGNAEPADPQHMAAGQVPLADKDVIEGTFSPVDEKAPKSAAPPSSKPTKRAARPGKSLSETLRTIAAGGMPQTIKPASAPPDLPEGAKLLSLSHTNAQGSRDYLLYVPAKTSARPMPLIVMLHGCTQTPQDFATGTNMNALAEDAGYLVAWPAQPQGANAQKCWNWFRPEDQARDRGEPAVLAGIIRDILRDHPVDASRVYVAGLSAGGAAAAIMGAAYPDLIAAVGVHSGLPVGGAQDVMSAFSAMRSGSPGKAQAKAIPTIVLHGLADSTVHPSNGTAVIAQATKSCKGLKRVQGSGATDAGRSYRHTRHEDMAGRSFAEHWEIDGAGHAWSGGRPGGSYTDPTGPDASREMLRFFAQHRRT